MRKLRRRELFHKLIQANVPHTRRLTMLEISDSAQRELDAFFEDKDKTPIRVYLAPGGCAGPRLALALDQPNDADKVFDSKGYSFCINNDLLSQAKNVKVDFSDIGFTVQSELQFASGGCGGCSGCGTA